MGAANLVLRSKTTCLFTEKSVNAIISYLKYLSSVLGDPKQFSAAQVFNSSCPENRLPPKCFVDEDPQFFSQGEKSAAQTTLGYALDEDPGLRPPSQRKEI